MDSRTLWTGLALVLAAFGSTLASSFHFDDYALLNDPVIQSSSGWREVFRLEQTRPLTYLTFWINYQLGGASPWGYHLVNLVLHGMTAFCAWSIFRRLLPWQAATLGAAVFALHPLQTEAVAYVFARATLLAALFALLSWRAWIRHKYWLSAGYFGAALLAKEEAIALPLFLLGFEWLYRPRPQGGWGRWRGPWAAMLALAAAAAGRLFYAASVTKGAGIAFDLGPITPANYLLTQGRAAWEYLRLVCLPVGLNFDRDFRLSVGLDLSAGVAWAALIAVIVLCAGYVKRFPHLYWFLGALLLLAPTSSIVPLADLFAERRMYLPLMSLSMGIGVLLARAPRYLVFGLPLVLTFLSFQRSSVWRTEESLWRDTVAQSPAKVRPKLQLARALAAKGQGSREEQYRLLQQAKAQAPGDPDVATELGVFYLQAGKPVEAIEELSIAREALSGDAQALANYGAALYMAGRKADAVAVFQEALKLDPCNFDARNNLILVYRRRGDREGALRLADAPGHCRFAVDQWRALESFHELRR